LEYFTQGKRILSFVERGQKIADPLEKPTLLAYWTREHRGHYTQKLD